jgi:hypothetical protein
MENSKFSKISPPIASVLKGLRQLAVAVMWNQELRIVLTGNVEKNIVNIMTLDR